ncbi:hypothetical protein AALP_AA5G110600 [Arabis alpina]|uniref:Uncharacterized protein n=1 Tax=Arabis alpina TaxID=50452 RepID=A0A087GWC5_ARAAL|nr:hypothetical protein AALP_AA5G110600 [Arabis alpina]
MRLHAISRILTFVITINKIQWQILKKIGLFLPKLIFSHGQLCVVLSRVKSRIGLKILIIFKEPNLANFAYDPYNYTILRQLNVLELFIEKLPKNAATTVEAYGISLIIKCQSIPARNTVNYVLGALYYIAEVVDLIKRYAAAESVSISFSNLAKAFLDKHVNANT